MCEINCVLIIRKYAFLFLSCLICTGSLTSQAQSDDIEVWLNDSVTVKRLAEGVWLHTTYYDISGYKNVPANGLIVIDGKHAMMIDLPWTDEQAGVLFDWVAREQKATIQRVVPTHFHIDCAGGLAEANRRGAESFALRKTVELLKKDNKPVPRNWFTERVGLSCGDIHVELSFPRAGGILLIISWRGYRPGRYCSAAVWLNL